MHTIQCAARVLRHRAASLFPGIVFSGIFLILGYQILMILSDFGGPGAHFLMIFEYFGGLGHILTPRLGFFRFLRFYRRESLPPFWPKMDQKSSKIRCQTQHFFGSLFWSTLEPSWSRFARILGGFWESKTMPTKTLTKMWKLCFRLGENQKMEVRRPPKNHQKSMKKRLRKHVHKKSPTLVQNEPTWGPTWVPRGDRILVSAPLGA